MMCRVRNRHHMGIDRPFVWDPFIHGAHGALHEALHGDTSCPWTHTWYSCSPGTLHRDTSSGHNDFDDCSRMAGIDD